MFQNGMFTFKLHGSTANLITSRSSCMMISWPAVSSFFRWVCIRIAIGELAQGMNRYRELLHRRSCGCRLSELPDEHSGTGLKLVCAGSANRYVFTTRQMVQNLLPDRRSLQSRL